MDNLSSTALLLISVFGGVPMASIIATFFGLWTRQQASREIEKVLAIHLEAFKHRLLQEMDSRHIGANGSRITGREIEKAMEELQKSMEQIEERVLTLERRGPRPNRPGGD